MAQRVAFFSYTRVDDGASSGLLRKIREQLESRLAFHLEEPVELRPGGEGMRERLERALDEGSLLVLMLSTRYFESTGCATELASFLDKARLIGKSDFILPVIWRRWTTDEEASETYRMLSEYAPRTSWIDWTRHSTRLARKIDADLEQDIEALGEEMADRLRGFKKRAAEAEDAAPAVESQVEPAQPLAPPAASPVAAPPSASPFDQMQAGVAPPSGGHWANAPSGHWANTPGAQPDAPRGGAGQWTAPGAPPAAPTQTPTPPPPPPAQVHAPAAAPGEPRDIAPSPAAPARRIPSPVRITAESAAGAADAQAAERPKFKVRRPGAPQREPAAKPRARPSAERRELAVAIGAPIASGLIATILFILLALLVQLALGGGELRRMVPFEQATLDAIRSAGFNDGVILRLFDPLKFAFRSTLVGMALSIILLPSLLALVIGQKIVWPLVPLIGVWLGLGVAALDTLQVMMQLYEYDLLVFPYVSSDRLIASLAYGVSLTLLLKLFAGMAPAKGAEGGRSGAR
ncbi:MAG: TIR domain-containing protein [Neomegalonema sp.]|nr:TIR domain-containing protein [Neomegalonema sp.]